MDFLHINTFIIRRILAIKVEFKAVEQRGDIAMNDFLEEDRLISTCEDMIRKIKDVISAKILVDPDGEISEIHVISKSSRSPKHIARDVESALVTILGKEIDHKKISIAQIDEDDEIEIPQVRLRIDKICITKKTGSLEVRVLLINPQGQILEGTSEGVASAQNRIKTIAAATLNAVQLFIDEKYKISLEDTYTYPIGQYDAVSVLIVLLKGKKEEYLLGSALVRDDIYEASAAAVLDAINRRISMLL
ncbi:hypothetical protein [Tepidanaerobacter syntrophicus]|uniref:hypothetical protein n=1 Tax=Tepidanaerobacter syntrophicus TaxID=224999 RepID=UPI00235644F3